MVPHRQSSGSVNARRVDLFISREPGNIDAREKSNATVYDFEVFIAVSRPEGKEKNNNNADKSEEIRAKLALLLRRATGFQKC